MKRCHLLLPVLCALAATMLAASCIRLGRPASEAAVTERGTNYRVFDVGSFDGLTASAVEVYVTVGEAAPTLRLEADEALIDRIEVANRNGMLCLNDRRDSARKAGKPRARVYLSIARLGEVYATAGARVVFDREVDAEIYATAATVEVDSLAVHARE